MKLRTFFMLKVRVDLFTCDMMTLAGHKEGFFVGFSLIFSDVVALSSFCWLSEGYNKLLAKMIMWNAHSWYVTPRVMTYEHVPFSLEMKTMMGKLKLEKTSVCAISYLGSALALRHCLKHKPYSSHKWQFNVVTISRWQLLRTRCWHEMIWLVHIFGS